MEPIPQEYRERAEYWVGNGSTVLFGWKQDGITWIVIVIRNGWVFGLRMWDNLFGGIHLSEDFAQKIP